jgi:hypothetical protein
MPKTRRQQPERKVVAEKSPEISINETEMRCFSTLSMEARVAAGHYADLATDRQVSSVSFDVRRT